MKRQKFLARFSRQTLTVKLVVTVSAVVCLIVTIGVLVLMDVSYRGIAQTSITTALYHAQFLKNKLIENMLDAKFDPKAFKVTLNHEAQRLGLKEVNVFNAEGETRFSSIPANINKKIDLTADQEVRVAPDRGLIHFSDMSRKGQLRIVHPIRGQALCMTCHENAQNGMLGGIELFVPLKPIYERFTVSRFILIFSALAIIILSAVLIRWMVHKIVKKPIERLIEDMEKAKKGHLDVKTVIKRDPDLRRLSNSFNTMIRGIRMSQRKIAEQHQRELAQSNRLASLGQFISNISHEIKNPLAAIGTTLHALRGESPFNDKQGILGELTAQVERIEQTVHNLLRYARQSPPRFKRCLVSGRLYHAYYLAEHHLKSRKIQTHFSIDKPEQAVNADEGQMEQVFLNLFLNAANAMPAGGGMSVRVRSVSGNEADHSSAGRSPGVLIEIEDTGAGIPSDILPRIFEPFFTTREGGTGLGLSVSKGIIAAHNGTIHAASTAGVGTTLTIFLPAEGNAGISGSDGKMPLTLAERL